MLSDRPFKLAAMRRGLEAGSALLSYRRLPSHYLALILIVTLCVATLTYVRARDEAFQSAQFIYLAVAFLLTLRRRQLGLVATIFLLTVGSALHAQLNALFGIHLRAWFYPGVDACVGFLAAMSISRDRKAMFSLPMARFPSTSILLLHGWVAVSCGVSIARNLWQSGSEFALSGLWFNTVHVRRIAWPHDFFPLQDLFFVSVAVLMLFAVWSMCLTCGRRLFARLAYGILAGSAVNATFAVWQQWTQRGWFFDAASRSPNAFLPDLHSFAAFMAMGFFLGLALLAEDARTRNERLILGAACLLTAAGLFLSHSRGTVFLVVALLLALSARLAFVGQGARRWGAVAMICLIGLAVDFLLTAGYRGFSYESLMSMAHDFRAESADAALSHRPEIWAAAMRMYSQFPLFGLGQGAFYRLSGIEAFSGSPQLAEWGGENAHNYFLQTAVELGPVGVGLILLCLYPIVRVGRANRSSVALFALIGMAAGNLYGHALLIRELLVLTAIVLAMYYWEAEQLVEHALRPVPPRTLRVLVSAFLVGGLLAAVEASASFDRFPFDFARRCHSLRTLPEDGWASGMYSMSLPKVTRRVELDLGWDRPDAVRRMLEIEVKVAEADGRVVAARRIDVASSPAEGAEVMFDLPPANSDYWLLSVTSSSCYVPFSVGSGYDPRLLGVQIRRLVGG